MMIKKICLFSFALLILFSCNRVNESFTDYEEDFYNKLEKELIKTKSDLTNYLNDIKKLAKEISRDKVMTSFFVAKKEYYALSKETILPESFVVTIEHLKQKIQNYYLLNFLNFYDILFVDKNGDIFYTIRKQKDYHKNIFRGELSNTALSEKLKTNPGESYVDFQFYEVSGEPSAFFIEPVISEKEFEGWFVLQCAINKIDKLFEGSPNLGQTGEVILVNKEHYMLTNSRFKVNSTILTQKLPEKNISTKFEERKGRKLVIDYRGREVYSVFEVIEVFDTEWLIIVKADKDEFEYEYYRENSEKLYPPLLRKLGNELAYSDEIETDTNVIHVDIDEFQRTEAGGVLFTQGVSTCTAIVISYPGSFSYLAHISPYDKIYGVNRTDLLSRLLKHISYFDIKESEKMNLEFYIASTQEKSFKNCIDQILEAGYFLSQVKIMYGQAYEYGNVIHNASTNKTLVNWKLTEDSIRFVSSDFKAQETINKLIFNIR